MNILPIDSRIAGAKTLWILRFPDRLEIAHHQKLRNPVELLIPTPFKQNEWMVVSRQCDENWIDSLRRFQHLCEEAKNRCQEQLATNGESLDETARKASEEILNFTALIRYFNEMMKHFRPPHPPSSDYPDRPDIV